MAPGCRSRSLPAAHLSEIVVARSFDCVVLSCFLKHSPQLRTVVPTSLAICRKYKLPRCLSHKPLFQGYPFTVLLYDMLKNLVRSYFKSKIWVVSSSSMDIRHRIQSYVLIRRLSPCLRLERIPRDRKSII